MTDLKNRIKHPRTAERRAYLTGEGKKRQEWGEQLVIVNKRGGSPCPHCLKWVGKILIDDVYSGGKPDGKHTLLSEAMADGFLHPRCKDGFTTYFPGISSTPDPVTKDEMREAVQAEQEENQENYAARQAEKYGRLAEYASQSITVFQSTPSVGRATAKGAKGSTSFALIFC